MTRIAWRSFDRGLWLSGGRDGVPEGALRRCTGVSQLRESGTLRSSRGLRLINSFAANQYITFGDALFQGVGASVLREGSVINAAFPQSGVLGLVPAPADRLSFLRMPPQFDLVDWLFVAGGNNPFKVQADGTTPSKWGIDAPPDGFVASAVQGTLKPIDTCDSAATWTRVESAGAVPVDETTIAIGGTTSMRFSFTQAGTNRYTKSVTVNLNNFGTIGGLPSADQDYIEFWIRLAGDTGPGQPLAENFDWMEIAFALGSATFDDNLFSRRVDGVDGTVSLAGLGDQAVGVASTFQSGSSSQAQLAGAFNSNTEQDVVDGTGVFGTGADTRLLLNALGQTQVMRQNDVWQRIRLPKATFDRTGGDKTLLWSDVQAVRLIWKRSGPIDILIDQIELSGGYAIVGDVQYQITYKNSVTGSRSNPNPTPVIVKKIDRERVQLGNLPTSADPQVDIVEAWRTVGNGAIPFKAFEVANGTLTAFDTVADFRGMYTGTGYLTDAQLPDVLQPLAVPLDNDPPPSTVREVLPRIHLGRAWWMDRAAGQRGNFFYSPEGRPESNQGFVFVTDTDDDLQTATLWNDTIYVFSTKGLFRIVGDAEPFTAQEVYGAPGTLAPDTVVATPFGIVYQAPDGIRLFDGNFSTLLAFDAIGPIERGYAVEDLTAFTAITGTYIREDYWCSDGTDQMFVCNLRNQSWRHYDLVFDTLYGSDDDVLLVGSVGLSIGETFGIEDLAADTAITFAIQTPSQRTAIDTQAIVQRILIDIDPAGLLVTPTLILDDSEIALAPLTGSGRLTVEYARLDLSRLVGVRLTASVTLAPIILYGIEADVYVPEGSGTRQ